MERAAARRIDRPLKLHAHQAKAAFNRDHDLIIQIGGIRSGKTVTDALWMADRSAWDTSQMHALFANTANQLDQNILREVYRWLDKWGIAHDRHRQPPPEWVERWRDEGIETPSAPDRYTNVLVLETGLHVYTGTLHNQSYRQVKGAEWGSLVVEEVCHGASQDAVEFLFDRVGCGTGPDFCLRNHAHQKWLKGNPPDDDHHWMFNFLAQLEKNSGEVFDGEPPEPSEDSPYPLLSAGVGDVIFISSSTYDNQVNLAHRFIEKNANVLDADSAKRRLGGLMIRARRGRAYNAFTRENERPVAYDPDRTLYVFLDFNVNPSVAGFAHPLRAGEYPEGHEQPGVSHVGVFGEFFHIGGMDAYSLASSIVRGDRGSDGHFPSNWGGLKEHRAQVITFGDATANAKHMSGANSWQIIDEVFRGALRDVRTGSMRYTRDLPQANPLVQFRVRSVNAKFESATGIRSAWVDPRCENLIMDFNICAWNKDGTDLQKWGERGGSKYWLRTHLSDGFGYMVYQLFPMGRDAGGQSSPADVMNGLEAFSKTEIEPPWMR